RLQRMSRAAIEGRLCLVRLIPMAGFAAAALLASNVMKSGEANPGMVACLSSISPASKSYSADSASDSVQVTMLSNGCDWSVVSSTAWINITSPMVNNGTKPFGFTIQSNAGAPNANTAQRVGTVTVTDASPPNITMTFTATQSGCNFSVPSNSICVPANSGSYNASILTGSTTACPWTATGSTSWITINPPSGAGDSSASYSVAQNSGATARTGTFIAAGHPVTVNQAGAASCAFPIAPNAQSFSA